VGLRKRLQRAALILNNNGVLAEALVLISLDPVQLVEEGLLILNHMEVTALNHQALAPALDMLPSTAIDPLVMALILELDFLEALEHMEALDSPEKGWDLVLELVFLEAQWVPWL